MRTISRFATAFARQAPKQDFFLPMGEWLPDQPDLSNPGCNVATNVIPITDRSYGPFPSAQAFSDPLTAYCRGAFSARDTSGNVANFAGDATKLYKSNGTAWDDKTNTGGAYSLGSADYWEFQQFGDRVIAVTIAEEIQSFILASSSEFEDLSGDAPKAKTVQVIKDFVVVGDTNDGVDGDQPNRVWWSAIGDPTSWPTPGTAAAAQVQSDYQNLPGTGRVQKIISAVGGADGAVFCENGIHRIDYNGPPTVFAFDQIEGARGTPAPRSVINIGPVAFYIGEDLGFYMFNGASSTPIGNQRVDKYFASDVNENQLNRITAVASPDDKLVMWGYMSEDASVHPDSIIIYNWAIDRFSMANLDHEILRRATQDGYTLEQLDNIDSNIDTFPYNFDDPILQGGATLLSIFDTANKAANLDGSNLAAEVETTEANTRSRTYIDGVRPIVDNDDEVTCAIKYRDTQEESVTTTSYTSRGTEGICFNRADARYLRASMKIAAGASWTHLQGAEPYSAEDGMR